MGNSILLRGMITGMKSMGAEYVKVDNNHFYFNVTKNSEIDNDDKLIRAKEAFKKTFGLGLKIKRIDTI